MTKYQYDNEVNIDFAGREIIKALEGVMIGPVPGGTAKLLAPILCKALVERKIPYLRVVTRSKP